MCAVENKNGSDEKSCTNYCHYLAQSNKAFFVRKGTRLKTKWHIRYPKRSSTFFSVIFPKFCTSREFFFFGQIRIDMTWETHIAFFVVWPYKITSFFGDSRKEPSCQSGSVISFLLSEDELFFNIHTAVWFVPFSAMAPLVFKEFHIFLYNFFCRWMWIYQPSILR